MRRRLLGRAVVTGACTGLLIAALGALSCWWLRAGGLRPWTALVGAGAGAVIGALVARRRRWSDPELALYLDAKLGSNELISSALQCQQLDDAASDDVVERATTLLAERAPESARPGVWYRRHLIGLAGAAGIVAFSVLPLPAAPSRPPASPGTKLLRLNDVPGLDRIVELERVEGRDPEQTKRLRRIADEARRLREQLRAGAPLREAQAELAKLRDDVAAEQISLGNEHNRAGLEAAVRELSRRAALAAAAEALGNGDLVEFDREMQELARGVEDEHRKEAKAALEEAERRAKERAARELADSLGKQRELFERRSAGAQALRELSDALGDRLSDEARRDLEEFGETGNPEALERFNRALEDALGKLTPEQRKRLAERLKQRAQADSAEPLTAKQLEELARRLDSPEGRRELLEQLERMAKEGSPDADRERSLDDAERGGAEAQRGLGMPLPMTGPGPAQNGGKPGGKPGSGSAGQGKSGGEGRGNHDGSTPPVARGKGLVAKAETTLNPGAPMHGAALGRSPARPGETAKQAGQGAIGNAAPSELGAVERSDVPEEYREQVGRYFQP